MKNRCSDFCELFRRSTFSAFYRNLVRKFRPVCTEEIACAYWVYLYTQKHYS